MTTTQWIFVVFFAIFWGAITSVQGRWKMFPWPLVSYSHVLRRILLSVLVVNVLPVLFFGLVFYLLRGTPTTPVSAWSLGETLLQVVAGVAPAFAVFGFYRLWVGVVQYSPKAFYQSKAEQDETTRDVDPSREELAIVSKLAAGNLGSALGYFVLAAGVPWLLA